MNITDFISDLLSKDIHIWIEDEKLRINAPKGALTLELRETLTAHKAEIMVFLEMANGARDSEVTKIHRVAQDQEIPLSFSQHRLWFLDQFQPGSTAYSVLFAIQVNGNLDTAILEKTYNEIVRRHDALRTIFVPGENGQPLQKIIPFTSFSLLIHTLDDFPEEQRSEEALAYLREQARIPFDLSRGPLYRFLVVRLSKQTHILLYNMHHTVYDGWSTGVFFNEMAQLYNAYGAGRPSPLPELPFQYADYSVWQRQAQTPQTFHKQLDYWKKKLAGTLPILELPADHPRPTNQTFTGELQSILLSKSLGEQLKAVANRHEVTLVTVLLAAFKSLIYRYSGQTDVIVGTPVANRHSVEVERLIGFFVNTLVLRTDLSGNPTFSKLLHSLRESSFEAFAHQEMPFEFLVEELHLQRDTSHSPVFQVMFIHQNMPSRSLNISGWTVTPLVVDSGSAKFDLTVIMGESDEGLHCAFEYNTDLFDFETIRRMLGHFQTVLEAVCSDTQQRLDDLPLLSEVERRQALNDWNNTQAAFPDHCLQELFEAQAVRTPEHIAVQFEEQSITYAELNRRSSQLARYLRLHEVGPEKLVGIHIDRSIDMVVALLAVLKAGGAYVPLDPHFPAERLAYMLEDSGAPVLLTQNRLAGTLTSVSTQVICVDTDWPRIAQQSAVPFESGSSPNNLAYVIYTSGSTGRPKGVQVTQRNLVNFLTAMQREPGLSEQDVLLSVTTLSFDIAGLELYLPLISGARLVLASSTVAADGARLAQTLEENNVSVMQATPATWRLLIAAGWVGNEGLKILCGGEAFPSDLVSALLQRCGSLWNMYGPTETTIWSTLSPIISADEVVTIGRPIANTSVYLLDTHGQPVPVGIPGELYIGGDGVARGYRNRPELTAERFLPNPFGRPEDRFYRTGDLCRYLPDGRIEYLGRIDNQVKLRGFRIELGEIETVLSQHPAVHQAVVIAREDTPGDKRLVAYLTLQGPQPSTSELRAHLHEKLPEYMLPAAYITMHALPLTPNGKVDRRALPAPDLNRPDLETSFTAPRDAIERTLAEIWQAALKVDHVGIHDNFFELGGHSLLIVQVHHRVCQHFQTDLTIAHMFQFPTIHALAQYLSRPQNNPSETPRQDVQERALLQKEAINRQRRVMKPGGSTT